MVKITKRLTTNGDSLCIIVDKPIVQKLGAKKGDYIEADLMKV